MSSEQVSKNSLSFMSTHYLLSDRACNKTGFLNINNIKSYFHFNTLVITNNISDNNHVKRKKIKLGTNY